MPKLTDRPSAVDKSHPDFITALKRGLTVLEAFDAGPRHMTLSEVSARVGLSRGTTRRLLLTLVELGFMAFDGKAFSLTPRVMRLGFSFLSSIGIGAAAQPIVTALSARLNESCSLAILDGYDLVFVARAEARHVFRTTLAVGVRLPAHATSLGRVLLAGMTDDTLDAALSQMPVAALTPKTTTDKGELRAQILKVRQDGFAMVEDELQLGIRSVAVPVLGQGGTVEAALNVGALTPRTSFDTMRAEYVPLLRAAAREIRGRAPPDRDA